MMCHPFALCALFLLTCSCFGCSNAHPQHFARQASAKTAGRNAVAEVHSSIESLRSRWVEMESSVCGPKSGQAHLLIYQHNMTLGNEQAQWKVGPYYKSPRTTKSDIWTVEERPVYSNPFMMLQGNAIKPWIRMTKSEVLIFWHRGTSMVVHTMDPKGYYKETIVGDALLDPNAKYSLKLEPNTWYAMELEQPDDENSFAFFSTVLVPGFKREFMETGEEEKLVKLVGEDHREAIVRLLTQPGDNAPNETAAEEDLMKS